MYQLALLDELFLICRINNKDVKYITFGGLP